MEEIANGRLASVINNPNSQVRMAPAGINEIAAIYNSAASPDVKAYEFLSLINSDIGPNAFGASGTPLNVVVGFSVTYNVARITWAPIVVEGSQCLTQNFDLSNTPFRLSEAAEYRVFRNGRLIAKFLGEVATGRDTVRLPKLRTGFVSIRIGVPLPNNPDLSDVNETPILYDFDPYQGAPGTPLKYEVQAQRRGCVGAGGILSGDLGSFDKVPNIWVDGDGDSRPDFIPFGAWSTLLNATARGRIAYQSGGYYSNVSSMVIRNNGAGRLENLSVYCSRSGRVLQQPSSTLEPGQSTSIVTFHNSSSGSYCGPVFSATNSMNSPYRPGISY